MEYARIHPAVHPTLVSDKTVLHPTLRATKWPFLDFVRGGAALLVMLGHARGQLLPEFGAVPNPGLLTKVLYLATGLQHEAVVLFFIVSGFLVGGGVWDAFATGRFNPVRYLGNRFARIYLVLVPGLALTALVMLIGKTWFAATPSFAALPEQTWSWSMALCHLACLQAISCSVIVGNAPLWSLAYEWLLYLAAPLVLGIALAPAPYLWRAISLGILAATALSLLPAHIEWQWAAWWAMGAIASRYATGQPVSWPVGAAGLVAVVCGLLASRLRILPPLTTDAAVALGLALALACPAVLSRTPCARISDILARCSYSLYVIHLPLVLLIVAIMNSVWGPLTPALDARQIVIYLILCTVVVICASVFAHFTERHTQRLQRLLSERASN